MVLLGLVCNLWLVREGWQQELGALDVRWTLRYALWGFTLMVFGVQTVFGSFFLGLLRLTADRRKKDRGEEPSAQRQQVQKRKHLLALRARGDSWPHRGGSFPMSEPRAWKRPPNAVSLLCLVLLAAAYFSPPADLDFTWQIRTGEHIVRTGQLRV